MNKYKPLFPIGDLHLGHWGWNQVKDKFDEIIDSIYKDPEAVILLMGDLMECQTARSVGTGQILDINDQKKAILKYFKPFAREGRIIGYLEGNHEYRIQRDVKNYDFCKDMAETLGIDNYEGAMLSTNFNGYEIYAIHPQSSATTDGGRDLTFRKMLNIREADLYLCGHFHTLYNRNHTARFYGKSMRQKQMACTGAFLTYRTSYAEKKLYEPQLNGYNEIKLYNDEFKIEVIPHYIIQEPIYDLDVMNNRQWKSYFDSHRETYKTYRKIYHKEYYHRPEIMEKTKKAQKKYREKNIDKLNTRAREVYRLKKEGLWDYENRCEINEVK